MILERHLTKYFAYEQPRPKQIELASKVYEALANGRHLILQAPTGFGKTAGVLAGILPFIEETGARVYYAVRTHREAEVVIRELSRIGDVGAFPFHVLEIRGKRHLCKIALEKGIQPEVIDKYCSKLVQEKKCEFYLELRRRMSDASRTTHENILSSRSAFLLASSNRFCAYYFAKNRLPHSNLTIMPYPYITVDHLRRDLIRGDRRQRNLVIDECITADALVLTEAGQVKAKELFADDNPSVISISLNDSRIYGTDKRTVFIRRKEISNHVMEIRTDAGRILKLTGRTGVLEVRGTTHKWRPAAQLSIADTIMIFEDGTFSHERIIETTQKPSQCVYDFVSFPDHNYVVNGIVVHNSHNMPFVIANNRSWKLRVMDIEQALLEVYSLDAAAKSVVVGLLRFLKENRKEQVLVLEPSEFIDRIERILGGVPFDQILRILESSTNSVQETAFSSEVIVKSSLSYVTEFLNEVYRSRGSGSFFLQYVATETFPHCYLELSAFDLSSIGQKIFRNFNSVIHVSGTNQWEEAYAALIGVPAQYNKYVIDPHYDDANVFLAILETMSSRERDRTEQKYDTFSHILADLVNTITGKNALYFPSFEVLSAFKEKGFENLVDKEMFWEDDKMDTNQHQEMIRRFVSHPGKEGLLAGVMGGRSGEGVDFGPGILKGVIVFGVPFPEPCPKMEKYVEYLNKKFKGKGELYGYAYPAVIKAAQALGRAFRSPDDRVALILADDRYLSYGLFERFPNWVKRSLSGRYKDNARLLRDLEKFLIADWANTAQD